VEIGSNVTKCLAQFFPNGIILPFNIPNFLSRFVNVINVLGNTEVDLAVDVTGLGNAIHEKGMADLDHQLYKEASHAFSAQTILQPDNNIAFYNIACAEALLGNITDALLNLNKAIELGYSDLDHILQDKDFSLISHTKGFNFTISRLRNIIHPPVVADSKLSESIPTTNPAPVVKIPPEPVNIHLPEPIKISEPVTFQQSEPIKTSEPVKIPQPEPIPEPVNNPETDIIPDPLTDDWYLPELPSPNTFEYSAELEVLHDIGYLNDEIVKPILQKNNGNIHRTVFELLDM